MIKALRQIDSLYFGEHAGRDGRGSALSALAALLSGFMPWGFVQRYRRGDFDNELIK